MDFDNKDNDTKKLIYEKIILISLIRICFNFCLHNLFYRISSLLVSYLVLMEFIEFIVD